MNERQITIVARVVGLSAAVTGSAIAAFGHPEVGVSLGSVAVVTPVTERAARAVIRRRSSSPNNSR